MSTTHTNMIRAEDIGRDSAAQRCMGIIERGMERFAVQQKLAALQHIEFRAMVKANAVPEVERRAHRHSPARRMTAEQIAEMMRLRRSGVSAANIAEKLECSNATVVRNTIGWRINT